jgi:hypothetical protein
MLVLVKRNVYLHSGMYLRKDPTPQEVPDTLYVECKASPDNVIKILKAPPTAAANAANAAKKAKAKEVKAEE